MAPISVTGQFEQVWRNARTVGQYQFEVSGLQTNLPTPRLENLGRSPESVLVSATGVVDMPTDKMEMYLTLIHLFFLI